MEFVMHMLHGKNDGVDTLTGKGWSHVIVAITFKVQTQSESEMWRSMHWDGLSKISNNTRLKSNRFILNHKLSERIYFKHRAGQ